MTRINRSVLPLFGALVRARLWPDSSVASTQTFKQQQIFPRQIKKLVARLLVRQGLTSHLPLHRQTDRLQTTDTKKIPLTEILDRIFTSAPGGVAAPKILPRDFLYCSRSVGIKKCVSSDAL